MQTAGGSVDANVYDVRIAFLFAEQRDERGKVVGEGQLFNSAIQALEFDPGGGNYQVLLGRDILKIGILSMSFGGHYTFSY